jgi:hypothetical protein
MALAGADRLEESADEAARALVLLRRKGETRVELQLLLSHGDVLTALGRPHEAEEAWRRFLTLATSPERVQNANDFDDTDGSVIIDRVKAKLAELTTARDPRERPSPQHEGWGRIAAPTQPRPDW